MALTSKEKSAVFKEIGKRIQEKIDLIRETIDTIKDGKETRNSMGDKYETDTAMKHLEEEKYARMLEDAIKQQNIIDQIDSDRKHDEANIGSLVETDKGLFLLAISMGRLKNSSPEVMVISNASPIGQQIVGKKEGESFEFRDQKYKIKSIL